MRLVDRKTNFHYPISIIAKRTVIMTKSTLRLGALSVSAMLGGNNLRPRTRSMASYRAVYVNFPVMATYDCHLESRYATNTRNLGDISWLNVSQGEMQASGQLGRYRERLLMS